MQRKTKSLTGVALAMLMLAACARSEAEAPATPTKEADATNLAARLTLEVRGTELAADIPTETLAPEPTATPEPSLTPTEAPTAVPAMISVSANTNCRSGPDQTFAFLGVLAEGENADVVAKSQTEDYWYIVNPDDPEGFCWLWGEYATIEGDVRNLPVFTPAPTNTPQVGFDVWFHGIANCSYGDVAIFAIRNAGAQRLWSGFVTVYVVGTGERLYGPARERHPFAESDPACPPGHGNELYPGEVLYIHTPLDPAPAGSDAYAEITLCSADHGGGDCVTKIGYFYIP